MRRIVIVSLIVAVMMPAVALADPWADTVVSYDAGDATDYLNSAAALGEPSRTTAAWPSGVESVRMTAAPLFSFGGLMGQVYVSQDNATWYEVTDAGTMFPTQAYLSPEADAWAAGAAPCDYTLPVDPGLSLDALAGLTLTQAMVLYNGSGGGMGIDLSGLEGGTVSLDWISYVRIEGQTNAVDGFADVAVPEPATAALLAMGLAALVLRRRRRRDGRWPDLPVRKNP